MASIESYTLKDGRELWLCRWRDSQGRQHEKARFPNKTAARRYGQAQEVARDNDEEVLDTRTTVGDILHTELDMRSASIRHNSRLVYRSIVRSFEQHPRFTALRVRTLDEETVQSVMNWLSLPKEDGGRGLTPSSVAGCWSFLKAALRRAARARLIKWLTVEQMKITVPPSVQREIVALNLPQVRRTVDAMPPHLRAMTITHAGLGVRRGELYGLCVPDFTFPLSVVGATPLLRTGEQGSVRVGSQILARTGERAPTKNSRRKAFRDVPLPVGVARAVLAHMQAHPPLSWGGSRLVFYDPDRREPYRAGPATEYAKVLADVAERVGDGDPDWPSVRMGRRVTCHDLRHHYVSLLAAKGYDAAKIGERIGDTTDVVIRTYWHILPSVDPGAVDPIDEAWGADGRAEDVGDSWGENPLRGL